MAEPWTDARIREAFIDDGGLSEYHDPINGARDQRRIAGRIFDEWLAEVEARAASKAIRALAEIEWNPNYPPLPPAVRTWLRGHAAAIEAPFRGDGRYFDRPIPASHDTDRSSDA